MGKKGKDHDPFGANGSVEYATQYHGNRKPYKPHLVYETKLSCGKIKCPAKLRQNARSYTERKGSCD